MIATQATQISTEVLLGKLQRTFRAGHGHSGRLRPGSHVVACVRASHHCNTARRRCYARAHRRPTDQVHDAVIALAEQGLALLLVWDETSRLMVLRTGEVFRLHHLLPFMRKPAISVLWTNLRFLFAMPFLPFSTAYLPRNG